MHGTVRVNMTHIQKATKDVNSLIKHIITNVHDIRQRTCLLLLYEVYMKLQEPLQYHGGITFRKSVNKPHFLANTILSL